MPAGYAGRLNGLYWRKWNMVTKNKKDSELMMLRFLAVQLCATTPAPVVQMQWQRPVR